MRDNLETLENSGQRQKTGRNMNFTSKQNFRIWKELKSGNKNYMKNAEICKKCDGKGWKMDKTQANPKSDNCPVCDGYGFILKRI